MPDCCDHPTPSRWVANTHRPRRSGNALVLGLEALEPSFRKPDAFFAVPQEEREYRTLDSKDTCAVRDVADKLRQYFLRVLMSFTVDGVEDKYSWGLWVEVAYEHFERVSDLWDDPHQDQEPPFPGQIANRLPGYPDSRSIVGLVTLTDPSNVPHFHITDPPGHQLAVWQAASVSPEQALEWVLPIYHPEALIDALQNERQPTVP